MRRMKTAEKTRREGKEEKKRSTQSPQLSSDNGNEWLRTAVTGTVPAHRPLSNVHVILPTRQNAQEGSFCPPARINTRNPRPPRRTHGEKVEQRGNVATARAALCVLQATSGDKRRERHERERGERVCERGKPATSYPSTLEADP